MLEFKIRKDFLFNDEESFELISQSKNQFYVYILVNPITMAPFYVGKGTGDRCFSHYYLRLKEDNPKSRYLRKIKRKPLYFFYHFCDDENEAYGKEAFLIYKLGLKTKGKGLLYNISEGQGEVYHKYKSSEMIKKLIDLDTENKYDYSNSVYKGYQFPIDIYCKNHGKFKQSFQSHYNGQGCPKCSGQSLSTDDVIKLCKEKHGDRYDYSNTIYENSYTEIEIICSKHGSFFMKPSAHFRRGFHCPECSGKVRTNEQAIEDMKRACKADYDFSHIEYKGVHSPLKIVCKHHGVFYESYRRIIKGCLCPKCSPKNRTTKQAIGDLKSLMGDNYSFEKTIYVKSREPMTITCKKHGDFSLSYNRIMSSGRGCPKCGMERLSGPRKS